MNIIQEDYVSFETAKLLKAAGYPQCKREEQYAGSKYTVDGELTHAPYAVHYAAPPLHRAMKWLREVHHYIIEIHYGNVGSPREPEMQWWWELENKQGEFLDGNITDGNTTYEEAAEAAIKYCLENLI